MDRYNKQIKHMKVSTEDCVNAIIKHIKLSDISNDSPLLDPKQWKRLSKSGKGNSIVRVFRNKKTTDLINVTASEYEIISVDKPNSTVSNFNNFVATQKRNIKCKCKNCGSSNVMLSISPSDGETGYDIKPTKLSQKKAKKLVKNGDLSIWICLGVCSDETSAVVEIDDKKIKDSDDFIEYIADYGNPILDTDVSPISKKKDIIKAVKIGDLVEVQEYIDAGNNLDTYIGELPENKNMSGISETNWTLLQYAIDEQQWDVAIALINGGCDVNKNMRHLKTNAIITILQNKWRSPKIYDVIDALMTHGGDLSFKSYNGEDIFHSAWESKKKHKQYIIDNYPEQYKIYLAKK